MKLLDLFKRKTVVRASTKEMRQEWTKYQQTHEQLARELGRDIQFRARMGESQGVK